ncbi:MAG: hypothetical protein SFV23_09080 [Planctomycetaceae bacterium]|nr:hypothetical protein [Planctomycetaceae bacterium]
MPRLSWMTSVLVVAFAGLGMPAYGQVVPGSGTKLPNVGDNFEDSSFTFTLNLPKASTNIDKVQRTPAGFSSNNKWFESTYRGTPDVVKWVEAPAGALPGSKGAMLIQTLQSGVPGRLSNEFQQDDLIANFATTIGYLPVSRTPSVVCRVYLPPFEQWERRTGSHFGFRADCQTIITKQGGRSGGLFRSVSRTSREVEAYWPGFFIQFNSKADRAIEKESASILVRSGSRGEDLPGPTITEPGWWTFGMSFTPDGKVHYYAHAGVEPLTAKDHISSQFPYSYQAMQLNTFFFNIVNMDNGRAWSTPFIIDDCEVFVLQ